MGRQTTRRPASHILRPFSAPSCKATDLEGHRTLPLYSGFLSLPSRDRSTNDGLCMRRPNLEDAIGNVFHDEDVIFKHNIQNTVFKQTPVETARMTNPKMF